MTSRSYTALLGQGLGLPEGWYSLFSVPAGELWVVRNMDAFLGSGPTLKTFGFYVSDQNEYPLWGVQLPYANGGVSYYWEGRQAFTESQGMMFYSLDTGWNIRVTGYQFSAT